MDFRPVFSLKTTWSIHAPIEIVWLHLIDTERWSKWWPYVESVRECAPGNPDGIGNIREYVWRTCLPYKLTLKQRVIEVLPHCRIAVEVSGDLRGHGDCRLTWDAVNNLTKVDFNWDVQLCKHWPIWFTISAKPIFIWNHNKVMKQGELGLIKHLANMQ